MANLPPLVFYETTAQVLLLLFVVMAFELRLWGQVEEPPTEEEPPAEGEGSEEPEPQQEDEKAKFNRAYVKTFEASAPLITLAALFLGEVSALHALASGDGSALHAGFVTLGLIIGLSGASLPFIVRVVDLIGRAVPKGITKRQRLRLIIGVSLLPLGMLMLAASLFLPGG